MIELTCSECGRNLRIGDDAAGKRGKCPECGATLLIPQPEVVILEVADSNPTPPPPLLDEQSKDGTTPLPHPSEPERRKHRRWLALLVVVALIVSPFAPKLPLWFGIILLVLCAAACIPRVQGLSRRLLRLNPGAKWRSGFRIAMFGLVGFILILAGWTGAEYRAEQEKIAAKQAREEAEQRRLASEADARIAALVSEAEAAWRDGDSALAGEKLESASEIPHATNLHPIRQLRARMANAEVESLMAEASKAVRSGDIDVAKDRVRAALAIPHANDLAEARRLDQQIVNATDPARTRAALMDLSGEAFQQLQENGAMPVELLSGYPALDDRTADLANAQLSEVAAAREQRRQEQLERERAAAEARRQREQAAAEARRKAEEEQEARERAAAEARRQEERQERIEGGFSGWDGSHKALTRLIKSTMHNPDSYEHVETVYGDRGDHLVVQTTFRGTNGFGGVVTNSTRAKVDLDGNVLEILE